MKVKIIIIVLGLMSIGSVIAQNSEPNINVPSLKMNPIKYGAQRLREQALGKDEKLRFREIEALKLSDKWQEKYSEPMMGDGGRVIYHYGDSIHSVVCATLNVCDIELQAGEKVNPGGIHVGDSVRWKITPAISGNGRNKTTHLIIKPTASNLNTTMVVATDRRTYHFNLKSTSKDYMASVAFSYPEDQKLNWLNYYAQVEQETEKHRIDVGGVGILADNLDFDYEITGDSPAWLPVRVFNDGQKTYIQMPNAMKQTEAPAFLVLDEYGGEMIVNYRVRDDKYIIDRLFDEGILIAGVGSKQQRVNIVYENYINSNSANSYFERDER